MKKLNLMIVSTALALNSASIKYAYSNSSASADASQNTMRVVTEEYPPLNYMKDGKIAGKSTAVVEEIFKIAGIKPDIQLMPWARAYNISQTTPGVLIYSIVKTEERSKLFKFIGPINKMESAFFALKATAEKMEKPKKLEDLKQYLTSTVSEDFDEQQLVKAGFEKGKNIASHPSIEAAFLSMKNSRTQFFICNSDTIDYMVEKLKINSSEIVKVYELSETEKKPQELYMAFSINTPDDIFDKMQKAYETYNNKSM